MANESFVARSINIDKWLYDEAIAPFKNKSRRIQELVMKGMLYEKEKAYKEADSKEEMNKGL
jgi:hypothetical protein